MASFSARAILKMPILRVLIIVAALSFCLRFAYMACTLHNYLFFLSDTFIWNMGFPLD